MTEPSARSSGRGISIGAEGQLGHGTVSDSRGRTRARKASPRASKSANWSKLAQAGESSTVSPGSASAAARPTAVARSPQTACGVSPSVARELLRRLADQIGLGDPAEMRAQRLDAAGLGPAAGDPADALEADQRLFGGVGVRRLGVVDEGHAARDADALHAVGEAGEAGEPLLDLAGREADGAAGRPGGAGVLVVVPAQQAPARPACRQAAICLPRHSVRWLRFMKTERASPRGRSRDRDQHRVVADRGEIAPLGLVDADDRGLRRADLEEAPLGGEIAADAAMPVEMVGREVEEDRDIRREPAGKLDLIGAELDDDDLARRAAGRDRARRGRYCRPSACAGRPDFSTWWISAVVVDLPFEPVTAMTFGAGSSSSSSSASAPKNRPTSLSTGTPFAQARAMAGCGAG